MEALIQAGADIDKANNNGYKALMDVTALICASQKVMLLSWGTYPGRGKCRLATNNGSTALMMASRSDHAAIVEALLHAGADVNKATMVYSSDGG